MRTKQAIKTTQHYTLTSPFKHTAFEQWLNTVNNVAGVNSNIVEPFAGSNRLVAMLPQLQDRFVSYDLEPEATEPNCISLTPIIQNDSIANFPTGFKVCITNPPYLAKNKATKQKIDIDPNYADLYLHALSLMLKNCDFVAAIIPASFLTNGQLLERCGAVVQLPCVMFENTTHPVCLALFYPYYLMREDLHVYEGGVYIGGFNAIKKCSDRYTNKPKFNVVKFSKPYGELILRAVDSTTELVNLRICSSEDNPGKQSDRSIVRVSLPERINLEDVCKRFNMLVSEWRNTTQDTLMTPFMGVRKDGRFRRRLDMKTAKLFINRVYAEIVGM